MTPRSLQKSFTPHKHMFPTGSWAYMINPGAIGESFDPVLQIDHFRMAHPTFPPHPHAGMSAVTYMFDDAETGFVNRDSLGDRSLIRPGDLHWTQAGAGMMHEEIPIEPGRWAHGFQIFVNLAAKHKNARPEALHLLREDMPVIDNGAGCRIKVVVGSQAGQTSPVTARLLTPLDLFDIALQPGAKGDVVLSDGARANVFVSVLKGSVRTPGGELRDNDTGWFGRSGGDGLQFEAGPEGAQIAVLSGVPLNEPVFPKGPFVGNSPADITAYIRRYQSGEMGQLAASF